jgi:serine/threonine protein kinase
LLTTLPTSLFSSSQRRASQREVIRFQDLVPINIIGEGTFGRVRLMQWTDPMTGAKRPFALKALEKGHLIAKKQVLAVVREKECMARCWHPFILKLEASYVSKYQVYMLLEFAVGGELFFHLKQAGCFSHEDTAIYGAMVVSALTYLHSKKIAHRDLKPENILFDEKGYLKLIDFGFAKLISDRSFTLCGTPEYLAPEIISNKGHNSACDWWSFGVMIHLMLTGRLPFRAQTQGDLFRAICKGKIMWPKDREVQDGGKDVITKLLNKSTSKRLGCSYKGPSEVANHPFFAHVDWANLEQRELAYVPFVPAASDIFDTSNFAKWEDYDCESKWIDFNQQPKLEELWTDVFDMGWQ